METYTAHNIASEPDLFNKVVSFSLFSRLRWECMGYSGSGKTVKFARLKVTEDGIRQINKYVDPDEICLIWNE